MAEIKKDEDWMQKKWRPAMGWMYMLVCICDMIVFPVLWSVLQTLQHQTVTQWNPLTLQGAGLFHLAMGAVLGIAAFGRTQEKIAGSANNIPTSTIVTPANSFSSGPTFIEPKFNPIVDPIVGFGGKLAPPAALQPEK